jgi:hypothetical protein
LLLLLLLPLLPLLLLPLLLLLLLLGPLERCAPVSLPLHKECTPRAEHGWQRGPATSSRRLWGLQ